MCIVVIALMSIRNEEISGSEISFRNDIENKRHTQAILGEGPRSR